MKKSSYDNHLTQDMATCARCGVTQKKAVLHQDVKLRPLVGSGKPSLTKNPDGLPDGANFRRDPRKPGDTHTEAELKAQDQAPWFCDDPERCTKHRIDAAVQADRQRIWSAVNQAFEVPTSRPAWVDPPAELTAGLKGKAYERHIKQLGKDLPKQSKVTPRLMEAKRIADKQAKAKRKCK